MNFVLNYSFPFYNLCVLSVHYLFPCSEITVQDSYLVHKPSLHSTVFLRNSFLLTMTLQTDWASTVSKTKHHCSSFYMSSVLKTHIGWWLIFDVQCVITPQNMVVIFYKYLHSVHLLFLYFYCKHTYRHWYLEMHYLEHLLHTYKRKSKLCKIDMRQRIG